MDLRDRYRGSLLGLAIGDALGTTLEFSQPGSFLPLEDMVGGGPLSAGLNASKKKAPVETTIAQNMILCGIL